MHKISSRILALLLVLCLLVGNITPALAAEDDGTDVTVSEPQSAPGATDPSTEPEADTTAPSDGTEPDTTPHGCSCRKHGAEYRSHGSPGRKHRADHGPHGSSRR